MKNHSNVGKGSQYCLETSQNQMSDIHSHLREIMEKNERLRRELLILKKTIKR